jgi:hypothetical protein
MRTKFRTLLLSAAFALAAVSQASAAWDADCLSSQTDKFTSISVMESAPPETATMAAVNESSEEVVAVASANIIVALPEDTDLQIAMEMAALAQPASEAPVASIAAAAEPPTSEIEATGSLSASLSTPLDTIEEVSLRDTPTAE